MVILEEMNLTKAYNKLNKLRPVRATKPVEAREQHLGNI